MWWVRNLWSSLSGDHHWPREDVTHLLCSLMTKHNRQSNGHRISCNFRQMYLLLSINTTNHCPLMRHTTIKEKVIEIKGIQKYSTHFLSRIFLPYWLKHQGRFGWRHTSVLLFHLANFAGFPSTEMTPFTASSILYDEELNC